MIIEVKDLIKRYNDFLAIDHLNLAIQEGEIFGFLGPNGAGKTTTISTISGLTNMDGGEVMIFDKSIKDYEMEIKKEIGIVPQDIAIFEDLSAYENLHYFGRLYGLRGPELKNSIEEALEFTGLTEKRKDLPKKFSGGMKRRLNIACAIIHQPKLVILDEPTVGIDPQSRNHIMQSIKELNRRGSTILYTSHYMEEVEEICTTIAIMDHGRVIAQGTKDELRSLVSTEEKVTIELSSVHFTIVEEMKKISGVIDCELQGNQVSVISKKNSNNLNKVIECIFTNHLEILSLNMEKPTLERVFLTLTGRSLRD